MAIAEIKLKAIAAEYLINGLNKVKALTSVGYKQYYAERQGKQIFNNVQFKAILSQMQAKNELKSDITKEKVLRDLENQRILAELKGDISSAISASVWQGKHLSMFSDNFNTNTVPVPVPLSDEARSRLKQIAAQASIKIA